MTLLNHIQPINTKKKTAGNIQYTPAALPPHSSITNECNPNYPNRWRNLTDQLTL